MVLGVLMTTVDSLTFEGGALPETLLFRGVFGSVQKLSLRSSHMYLHEYLHRVDCSSEGFAV